MLGKIIQALIVISLFVVFILIYFSDGTVKDLVFWGILLLFNYIGFLNED